MADELGTKVPAWKLRQQQQQQRFNTAPPPPVRQSANDELGGGTIRRSNRANNNELGGTRSPRMTSRLRKSSSNNNNELGGTSSHPGVPAWKLREQMKSAQRSRSSNNSNSGSDMDDTLSAGTASTGGSSTNYSSHPARTIRPVSRVPGGVDPALPPAFRAAFSRQRDDNFLSKSSIHSKSCSNTNSSDSFGTLDSDSENEDDDSFDGEDSFASLGSDADEDDDAYRESRNQLARLEIEKQQLSRDAKRGGPSSRMKKKLLGVHGTPLDFIAE